MCCISVLERVEIDGATKGRSNLAETEVDRCQVVSSQYLSHGLLHVAAENIQS